jgi:AbiV family abortive infection protein
MVTPEYLLKGAAYALEQCGLLLRDANLLYRNGSYASAVAVALFAREELGRWRILLDLRTKVLGGERVTIEEIQERCRGHVTKQEAGMLSFVMRVETDTALGGIFGTYVNAKHGSEEWQTAKEQLEQTTISFERHKQRMSALYVDPVPEGWNRPTKEISHVTAYAYLKGAADDYSVQYYNYTLGGADPELERWFSRPILAIPERPEMPPWLAATFHRHGL